MLRSSAFRRQDHPTPWPMTETLFKTRGHFLLDPGERIGFDQMKRTPSASGPGQPRPENSRTSIGQSTKDIQFGNRDLIVVA